MASSSRSDLDLVPVTMTIALPFLPGRTGVDEAGRGPLAGPLVVAGAVLPAGFDATGIRDSKKMTASAREKAFERILATCFYHIEIIAPAEVDRLNILAATMEGMRRVIVALGQTDVVIDGNQAPGAPGFCMETLIKGDDKDAAIAAASILAKVTRDRIMAAAHTDFPGYGFDHNMGYGAEDHLQGLKLLGPCPLHRRSFEPVKTMVNQPCLMQFD